jgi:predicted phosphodiesterase
VPLVEYDGDMVIMNPGSLSQPRGGSNYSYGMLIIDESGLRVSTLELR